jgi:hypothetical protein
MQKTQRGDAQYQYYGDRKQRIDAPKEWLKIFAMERVQHCRGPGRPKRQDRENYVCIAAIRLMVFR